MTLLGTIGISEQTHWTKELTYTITPKSGPMRSMETLLDANRAISEDLPAGFLKRYHWLAAGKLLLHASETGRVADINRATNELLNTVQREGWMNRGQSTPVLLNSQTR
jgi:hypothetical protein